MFNLKQPCNNCPFRKGQGQNFRLSEGRLAEILNAPAFQCHKTLDGSAEQCAGLMKILYDAGEPNQIMQVAIRLGVLDPEKLDPKNEAYADLWDVMEAHCTE